MFLPPNGGDGPIQIRIKLSVGLRVGNPPNELIESRDFGVG